MIELIEELAAAIKAFLDKLESRPQKVLTLDRKIGELIVALHDLPSTPSGANVDLDVRDSRFRLKLKKRALNSLLSLQV